MSFEGSADKEVEAVLCNKANNSNYHNIVSDSKHGDEAEENFSNKKLKRNWSDLQEHIESQGNEKNKKSNKNHIMQMQAKCGTGQTRKKIWVFLLFQLLLP